MTSVVKQMAGYFLQNHCSGGSMSRWALHRSAATAKHLYRVHRGLTLSFLLLGLLVASGFAQSVPELINYQGLAVDSNNAPLVTGEYALSVSIYSGATNSSLIWGPQEWGAVSNGVGKSAEKVPVVRGYYSLLLGQVDVNDDSLSEAFLQENTWIEVVCNGVTNARQHILSNPYAIRAHYARRSSGDFSVGANLDVEGDIGSSTGNMALGGTLTADDVVVSDDITVGDELTVTGKLTANGGLAFALDGTKGDEGSVKVGDIIIKWGKVTINTRDSAGYKLPEPFPTDCYVALSSRADQNKTYSIPVYNWNATHIYYDAYGSVNLPANFTYIAIGY